MKCYDSCYRHVPANLPQLCSAVRVLLTFTNITRINFWAFGMLILLNGSNGAASRTPNNMCVFSVSFNADQYDHFFQNQEYMSSSQRELDIICSGCRIYLGSTLYKVSTFSFTREEMHPTLRFSR